MNGCVLQRVLGEGTGESVNFAYKLQRLHRADSKKSFRSIRQLNLFPFHITFLAINPTRQIPLTSGHTQTHREKKSD